MNPESAAALFQIARDCGADFAELFVEETRRSSVTLRDKGVESASTGTEFGVGIRLLFGTEVLYAHSSEEDIEVLGPLIRNLCLGRSAQAQGVLALGQTQSYRQNMQIHPKDADAQRKLQMLFAYDEQCRLEKAVNQVSVSLADVYSHIQIWNTEGLALDQDRVRSRLFLQVTAGEGEKRITVSEAPGALQGFEFFESLDVHALSAKTRERAARMSTAGYLSGGSMPVVIGNGFGGVIFHEACGHPLETESIRKKASPFCDKRGELIAHPKVTAIDDGTIDGLWGSLPFDDEGMPTQKTTLIQDGVLQTYLSDRVGAAQVGVLRSGSARRESYKYAPVARMRNTYIAAGNDSLDSMLASMDHGLYAVKMGGGSVNPATGEFNFSVEEGYRVENGKAVELVRGATLIGKGHEILPLISMVGSDLEHAAGMCGASSGSVPVTVGQPTLKVDNILVGGR